MELLELVKDQTRSCVDRAKKSTKLRGLRKQCLSTGTSYQAKRLLELLSRSVNKCDKEGL